MIIISWMMEKKKKKRRIASQITDNCSYSRP
jgi:hypothetical protein